MRTEREVHDKSGSAEADKREVARGTAWSMLSWLIAAVTGPLLSVLLVRSMTHTQYGALSLAADAAGLLAVIASFGLAPALTHLVASERVRTGPSGEVSVFRTGLSIARVATGLAVPVTGLVALVFVVDSHLRPATPALLAMAPVVILGPAQGLILGPARAFGWPRLLALLNAASGVATAVAVIAVVLSGAPTAVKVGAAFDLRPLVFVAASFVPLWRWWTRAQRQGERLPDPLPASRVISLSAAFALALLFGVLVAQLDVLVLGAFRGARTAGLYSPAAAVAGFALAAPGVVGSWYLPVVTRRIAEGNQDAVSSLYHYATRAGLAFGGPLLAIVVVCPGAALAFLFGHGITVEATPLRLMGIGAVAATIAGFNSLTLDAHGLARFTTHRMLALIGVSIAACMVLVPFFGATGAALATVTAIVGENAVCSLALWRRFGLPPWDRRTAAVVTSLAVSTGLDFALEATTSDPLLRCVLVALCTLVIMGGTFLAMDGPSTGLSLLRTPIAASRAPDEGRSASRASGLAEPPSGIRDDR